MLKAVTTHSGWIKVSICVDDILKEISEFPNVVTNDAFDLFASALASTSVDTKIKYVALGTDNTTPVASDSTLGSEQFRKAVTTQTAGATGEMDTTVYIAPAEANFSIEEIGWFAGASATASANSGVLIARTLYSRTKVSSESIQIDRTDTFQGV